VKTRIMNTDARLRNVIITFVDESRCTSAAESNATAVCNNIVRAPKARK